MPFTVVTQMRFILPKMTITFVEKMKNLNKRRLEQIGSYSKKWEG